MTTTQNLEEEVSYEPYYSCDLSISIVNIDAKNVHHAEAVMQTFIDEISKVMEVEVRWDEADWEVMENVYIPELGEWHTR
jgi:hypothetical protein